MTQKTNPRDQRATSRQTKQNKTTFGDHISEIRRRVVIVVGAFLVTSALAYNYHEWLTKFIMRPLGDEKLVYLTPGGGFNFIFQISMYAGLLVIAPLIMYHVYGFLRPALPRRAQQSAVLVILCAVVLMAAGAAYGYLVAVPSALTFLSTFAGAEVTPNLTADSYLGFFLTYIVGLGVLFELPLLLLFMHWVKPMTPGGLLRSERFVIAGAFIVAALITPTPDVFNQMMIAVPLIAIYQLGAVAVLVAIYKQRKVRVRAEVKTVTPTPQDRPVALPAPRSDVASRPQVPVPLSSAPRVRRTMDGTIVRPVRTVPSSRVARMNQPGVRPASVRSARRLSIDGISNPL
ncbi:twin-arginine translocase subunit TatC [Streptomyces caniscabiei]|uniref:twin-arginine translocase subunit TatC n=1 Tax=Streptomyces caniscabiei TaxID=2746961 RepID=UPI0029BE35B5|nr:twin-arginine translocase subunit TatC [Streptomyces caniscabiei]MDX2776518.1 twin-arginine translocase subunit TatC [Streptomyces caniscabiei]